MVLVRDFFPFVLNWVAMIFVLLEADGGCQTMLLQKLLLSIVTQLLALFYFIEYSCAFAAVCCI